MKTFLTSAAAIVLGLSAQAFAVAGDGHSGRQSGHPANHGQVTNTGSGQVIQNTYKTNFTPIQTGATSVVGTGGNGTGNAKAGSGPGMNGKGRYTPFKEYKGPCYYGKNCNFWSKSCYNESYGCYTYWCPRSFCWFYWCQPYGCYLPVEYCPAGSYVFQQ